MKLSHIKLNPWQYLILSFLILIGLGTFFLNLPFVRHQNGLTFIDSLFTSTSAVCVTGLTTVNTSGFNWQGELVILILMQLGAIGIMTLSSSFILAVRGKISLKHKISFFRTQENSSLHDVNDILRFILIITFVSEFFGAVLLSIGFAAQGNSFWESVHQGIFHSVSAFCNAGFSTYDSSLMGMNDIIKYTVMALIIIGGIGYHVIYELVKKYKLKKRLSLHTKIVLLTTTSLIFGAALLIFIFERGQVSITDSLFQSVTARTAGFNTVNLLNLHYLSLFLIILLMFIGASPGSTGGGIKTTTFFIVAFSVFKILRGQKNVVVFNRQIPNTIILKSFAILSAYFMVAFFGTLALLYHNSHGFLNTLFEVVSALGTVGLSLGISAEVGMFGKLILIIIMFIGRVGPASIAMLNFKNEKEIKIKFPEESVY
ncbi:MAG: potassium transporter [Chlorobi bacterium]|nr:potassium transporter [Chlorobiota bacterium]